MRRTRLGNNRVLTQRLVFIVIALAFVGSGYLIGRYFLASLLQKSPIEQPVAGSQTGQNETETATVQVTTPSLTLYRVQIGAFSSKESADRLVSGALKQGVPAHTMTPDPLFKVYCGVSGSKNAAEKLASEAAPRLAGTVIGKTEKPYVASLNVPSYTFTLTGAKSQVNVIEEAYSTAGNAVSTLLAFWDGLYTNEATSVDLVAMETDLTEIKQSLSQITPETSLKPAYDAAVAIINDLTAAVTAAKAASGGDGNVAAGMVSFIEAIDCFTTSSKSLGS
jgi:hypothetical protein